MQRFKEKWVLINFVSVCFVCPYVYGAEGTQVAIQALEKIEAIETTETPSTQTTAFLQNWVAVDRATLEQMRGGFDIAPGLRVAFGIERLIKVNGVLQTITRIDMPDVNQLHQTAVSLPNQNTPITLTHAAVGSFVQNSLNNQVIQSVTVINASTNSLLMLKAANLQTTLRDALSQAVGTR